ncbi:MAG: phosphoribosylglycinamide formyltransferase, partial [Flavobacteriaceae bacterium]|nr:phosphoribosylglycinamide formyltransferase [Flavobacteriaceae bacterium]
MTKLHKILIFASGSGSNAEQIIRHFSPNPNVEIMGVYSNNPSAFVLERAKQHGVFTSTFDRSHFTNPAGLLVELLEKKPDLIILAGFLWKIPSAIIAAFPSKIINIHPSLLPKYGGKGMYGGRVHQAVI